MSLTLPAVPCHADCSVVLRRLQLALPIKLHELLLALDYKQDTAV